MYWLTPLFDCSIGKNILARRWKRRWGRECVSEIFPRSKSSWPSVSRWWRECVSRPHICWGTCLTLRWTTSDVTSDFWAAGSEEILKKCVVEKTAKCETSASLNQSTVTTALSTSKNAHQMKGKWHWMISVLENEVTLKFFSLMFWIFYIEIPLLQFTYLKVYLCN